MPKFAIYGEICAYYHHTQYDKLQYITQTITKMTNPSRINMTDIIEPQTNLPKITGRIIRYRKKVTEELVENLFYTGDDIEKPLSSESAIGPTK